MEITVQELNLLGKENYQLIDIRSEVEISHGAIPGAIVVPSEKIEGSQAVDFSKKLVICCSRGESSLEIAEELAKKGYSAANRMVIEENARKLNIPITIFEPDIFESVYHVEKSPCCMVPRYRQ